MPVTLTLGECVKQIAALMHNDKTPIPFKDERPWHLLFYELKTSLGGATRAHFLDDIVFDWDGEFPRCQELAEFLHALHWNASVSASNPHYDTIFLPEEVASLWNQRFADLDADSKTFLRNASEVAKRQFLATG